MTTQIPFRQLIAGAHARVVAVRAQGELGRRIRDMGLIPGAEFQIIGRAPLYDPVSLKLTDFTLTLRNNEADHILVQTLETSHA